MQTMNLISQVYIAVDGANLPTEVMDHLVSVEVDDSLHLPDMFTLCFRDQHVRLINANTLALGKAVEIKVRGPSGPVKLMAGEVTAFEPSFFSRTGPMLVVRGYDQSHRLHRGRKTRTFIQKKDSDIAQQIARDCGLRAQVDQTSQVHEYLLQDNQTDLEFLLWRASCVGYLLYVEDNTVYFKRNPPPPAQTPTLEYGVQLRDFHVHVSAAEQVNDVYVRAWDPNDKQHVLGHATSSQIPPQVTVERQGGRAVKKAYGIQPKEMVVDRPVASQAEADALAQAVLDEISSAYIRAEGTCAGDPRVSAGSTVNLTGLGSKYSGQYVVTHSVHRYDLHGYETRFTVSGRQSDSLLGLIRGSAAGKADRGLVIGVVSDNVDPKNQARVKVKFPWLDDSNASTWARLVTPMAGPSRGIEFIPEVNDEVLVAFEQGDMNRPLVLGALWNGRDAPPQSSSQAVSGGKVNKRTIRSRAGHEITLDDTNDKGSITIVDATGNNKIVIDSQANSLTIQAKGNVTIDADGDLTVGAKGQVSIKGAKGVKVEASAGSVDIDGPRVEIN